MTSDDITGKEQGTVKKILGFALRMLVGIAIIGYILAKLHSGIHGVDFTIVQADVKESAIYVDAADDSSAFVILKAAQDATLISTVQIKGSAENIAQAGALVLSGDQETGGVERIEWTSAQVTGSGLTLTLNAFSAAFQRWQWVAAGFFLFAAAFSIITYRWQMIIHCHDIAVPYLRCLAVTFIGMFFNCFMLGATGGDLAKAYYISREDKTKRPELISSVFIDRMLGLPALVLFAGIVMLIRLDLFISNPIMRMALIFVCVIFAAVCALFISAFSHNLFEKWRIFRWLEDKFSFGALLRRIYDAFYHIRKHPVLLAQAFALSIAGQFTVVVCSYCFGRALNINAPFMVYLTVIPTIMLVSAIPVTPGGVGIREAGMVLMMAPIGIQALEAFPLSVMMSLTITAWSLSGGLVFLLYTARSK